jgi:probable HAF family extracellular repeat protein
MPLVLRVAMVLILASLVPRVRAQSFQGLGNLNGQDSQANAISADGLVVVGWSSVAFRWTATTGMVQVGPANENSIAHGVSSDGSVVAGYYEPFNLEAFRWTASSGPVPLGQAPFVDPAAPYNVAYGISGDGLVIVGTTASNNPPNSNEAFRWTQVAGFQHLSGRAPVWGNVEGNGTSADGSVIVGQATRNDGRGWEAYRWTADSGIVGLGDLNGDPEFQSSTATAVSSNGAVVVGYADAPNSFDQAFRWTQATGMIGLGAFQTPFGIGGSQALAVNTDGSVIAGWSFGDNGEQASLWTQSGGLRSLRAVLTDAGLGPAIANWDFTRATGLSADGRVIVGYGANPQGQTEAFIARLGGSGGGDCGSADFNGDGDTGTDQDINAFFACLSGNCCTACGSADFNGDGDVGTDADIESFFRVLGGGLC